MDLREEIKLWHEEDKGKIDWIISTLTLPVYLAAMGIWDASDSIKGLKYRHEALRKEKGYFSNVIRYYKEPDFKESIDKAADDIWKERDPIHKFASFGAEMLTDEYIKSEFKKMCESGKLDVYCPDNVPMWQIKKYEEVKQKLLDNLSDKYQETFGKPFPDDK